MKSIYLIILSRKIPKFSWKFSEIQHLDDNDVEFQSKEVLFQQIAEENKTDVNQDVNNHRLKAFDGIYFSFFMEKSGFTVDELIFLSELVRTKYYFWRIKKFKGNSWLVFCSKWYI